MFVPFLRGLMFMVKTKSLAKNGAPKSTLKYPLALPATIRQGFKGFQSQTETLGTFVNYERKMFYNITPVACTIK